MALKEGDRIPSFKLKNQNNITIDINNHVGKMPLVIFFYPKDNTPGCTAEVCAFNDHYNDFSSAGAKIIGISADSPESHLQFASKYNLQYTLLSDPDSKVRELFGVASSMFGLLPGRVTYIIDSEGIIRNIISSQLNIKKHINASLITISKM